MNIQNKVGEFGERERELDRLFRAYREACPEPEPGANFMPALWQRIESRQSVSLRFSRMTRGFATAALALASVMAMLVAYEGQTASVFESGTYVEALASDHAAENSLYYEPVHISPVASFGDSSR